MPTSSAPQPDQEAEEPRGVKVHARFPKSSEGH